MRLSLGVTFCNTVIYISELCILKHIFNIMIFPAKLYYSKFLTRYKRSSLFPLNVNGNKKSFVNKTPRARCYKRFTTVNYNRNKISCTGQYIVDFNAVYLGLHVCLFCYGRKLRPYYHITLATGNGGIRSLESFYKDKHSSLFVHYISDREKYFIKQKLRSSELVIRWLKQSTGI